VPKSVRAAEAIRANPSKSDRAIAAELGVHNETVSRARRQLSHDATPDEGERVGRDGKAYSIRQRVTEDPDIPQKLAEQAVVYAHRWSGPTKAMPGASEDGVR
jgi:transposase-like protein